jgi:hypothetical protein
VIAHFTAAELPGTIGLVLGAFALGLLAGHRQLRPRRLTVPLLATMAVTVVLAVLADQDTVAVAGWIEDVADGALLAAAAALCALSLRNPLRIR